MSSVTRSARLSVDRVYYSAAKVFAAPSLPSRIPSLDGIRALSIAFVILSHLTGTANFPASLEPLSRLGGVGVRVFFVISGFLITTLLLKERALTGTISLKAFYLRRIFRIFPAFYCYVGIVGLLAWMGATRLLDKDLLHAVTYTMNYHHPHGWPLAHTWSLAVEEQFYLLWPAALVAGGLVRGFKGCLAVIALAPLVRAHMYFSDPAAMVGRSQEFQAVVDSLASGCLLAGLWNWLGARQRYQRLLRSGWFYLVPAATAAAVALQGRPRITYWVGQTVLNIGIAVCIERLVRYSGQAPAALFDLAAVRWVGVLSYSLYLWQQLFLNRNSTHWMTAFPVNLILCFTVAACSYYLVEKPFLRWKVRWSAHKRT